MSIPAVRTTGLVKLFLMKKELPITGKVGVFPKVAMSAVALASFMDSFCLQIIVPYLPFAVKKWFPGVYSVSYIYT